MKALIIDDENPVRIAIQKLVDWDSYDIDEVLMASNGREGLEIMRTHEPTYIFLDICMPIMNGLDFLEQAKEEYPHSQFIIVSGYDDFTYAQNALRYGATDYLLKPIDKESLANALNHAKQKIELDNEVAEIQQNLDSEQNDSSDLTPYQISEIIHDYIDNYYYENIKISMFSDKYFFSKEYISRNFKSRYGFGIYEYVLKVRMENAARMLKDDSIKIQDVGTKVGFPDNNYFSKAFRNYYDISPSEYRKNGGSLA